jgi:hypothetical protein
MLRPVAGAPGSEMNMKIRGKPLPPKYPCRTISLGDEDDSKETEVEGLTSLLAVVGGYLLVIAAYLIRIKKENVVPDTWAATFIDWYWLLPASGLLMWLPLVGPDLRLMHNVCSHGFVERLKRGRAAFVWCFYPLLCLNCKKGRERKRRFKKQVGKLLNFRRFLFQGVTGLTLWIVAELGEVYSYTLGFYLLGTGVCEALTLLVEIYSTLPECCQRMPQDDYLAASAPEESELLADLVPDAIP